MAAQKNILWFSQISKEDLPEVGGKGANLGEMVSFKISVPPGFVVTAIAYFSFLETNGLRPKIKEILSHLDKDDPFSYTQASQKIKNIILKAKMPQDLALEIMKAYLDLGYPQEVFVAIRSSATAEDLPKASFAGQQVTFLNIKGEANVVKKVQECWASLFEARAIFYRKQQSFDDLKVGIAVPVQKMIQSDTSGVMFTINPVTGEKNQILIEGIYGLGELIVQGAVIPDMYIVNKNTLKITSKKIATQTVQLKKEGSFNKEIRVPKQSQGKQKLTNRQIVELAKIGKKIHQHYFFPQDIEWGIEKGKIFILQTRPVTTIKEVQEKEEGFKEKEVVFKGILLNGIAASPGIATGPVRLIGSAREIGKVKKGEVLVTEMTTPDFVPAMRKVVAIVTDKGGQTSHAAIVSRELGLPCVVGTQQATKFLKNNQFITVDGSTGKIYKPVTEETQQVTRDALEKIEQVKVLPITYHVPPTKTATKVYVNLAEPDLAPEVAKKEVDGVGLLRAEFMMAEFGIHPKKLIHERKQKLFINYLTSKLSIFCEHFEPRPVIYRASDFKTNEYRHLIGGRAFEPQEANPMLGYRGAFRYLSDPGVFELELAAIKKVRQKFKNLSLMIPFVHQPWELMEVKKIVISTGLLRSPTFKLLMMVEIPSNVILLEDFLKIGLDGVSIGSNDLTMLLLGLDRDNNEVAPLFDERDPAVLWALEKIIKTCHQYHVPSSICGQAPSVYPDLVEKLVEWGVTSISVNPDAIEQTRRTIYEAEQHLIKKRSN